MSLWGYVYFLKYSSQKLRMILNKTDKVKFNLIFVEQ